MAYITPSGFNHKIRGLDRQGEKNKEVGFELKKEKKKKKRGKDLVLSF